MTTQQQNTRTKKKPEVSRGENKSSIRQDEVSNGISLARFLAHKNKLNDYFAKKVEQEKSALIEKYFGKNSDSNIFGKFMVKQNV